MKLLAIVPDPASAYGLGALLAALPPGTTRVVAYGQATAAVLPPGLDVFVYPVRDGTRLPAPFVEALVQHEAADALLAPSGSVTSTPVPTLLVDLDPRIVPPPLASGEDPASWTWVEGITALSERRPTLLRAGLFSVDVLADWYEGPGRLRASAASALFSRMTDLAGLLGRRRENGRSAPSAAPPPSAPPPRPGRPEGDFASLGISFGESEPQKKELPEVKSTFASPVTNLGPPTALHLPPPLPAPRIVPIEVRSGADPGAPPAGLPAASGGSGSAQPPWPSGNRSPPRRLPRRATRRRPTAGATRAGGPSCWDRSTGWTGSPRPS